jgi:protein-S-isoprenylcysteine O-methyltransferase Ste14
MHFLRTLGWLICVIYSTIPSFWLMIHPRAQRWRERQRSPFRILLPSWIVMWFAMGALTFPWRGTVFYSTPWTWLPAATLFAAGFFIYSSAGVNFSWTQLSGIPEVRGGNQHQTLVTTGIRSRIRHPIYLAHLCEMLAWSTGTGLEVCWLLTVFAIVTGAVMIRLEDAELEKRFGAEHVSYRQRVGAVLPKARMTRSFPDFPKLSL